MKITPLVSIITVVYNGEKYLQQTITSVYNQTYQNIEYIIIDGGSSDNTINIINQNADKVSKWISEPDEGLYDAMNKGIKLSNGEIIGIINSDDWYETNAVETVVNEYNKNPQKKIFHGDIRCVEQNGNSYIKKAKDNPFLIKYHAMVLNHPSMFIHKDIYSSVLYNTELISLSDYQFTLSIYLKNKKVFHYLPVVISNFRLGGISSGISSIQSLNDNFKARRNAGMSLMESIFAYILRIGFIVYKKTLKH